MQKIETNIEVVLSFIHDRYGIQINNHMVYYFVGESIFMNKNYCAVYDENKLVKSFTRNEFNEWLRSKKINRINDRIKR